MNTREVKFQPTNNIETLLISMPKRCSCTICNATKNMAKDTLGEKKFNKLCKTIGLAA